MSKQILLHICCAPDATTAVERLRENYQVIGYFGNSNIQPIEEYQKRKEAVIQLKNYYKIEIIFGGYDPNQWQREMQGLEDLKEGSARCRKCIYLNLRETAVKARSLGITAFTTSLMTSPHKDVNWIQKVGKSLEAKTGIYYHHELFRKRDGFLNSVKMSKTIGLYRQNYCGCNYSVYNRDGDTI